MLAGERSQLAAVVTPKRLPVMGRVGTGPVSMIHGAKTTANKQGTRHNCPSRLDGAPCAERRRTLSSGTSAASAPSCRVAACTVCTANPRAYGICPRHSSTRLAEAVHRAQARSACWRQRRAAVVSRSIQQHRRAAPATAARPGWLRRCVQTAGSRSAPERAPPAPRYPARAPAAHALARPTACTRRAAAAPGGAARARTRHGRTAYRRKTIK